MLMEKKLRAIIIDDEQRARRVLATSLLEIDANIEVVAEASDVPKGVLEINRHKPDVVFLDIEMPDYNGFELLGFFQEVDFEIIFVTAYNEYAIQAFEVSAIDYLLKPVRIDLLENAILKLEKKLESSTMFERLNALKTNLGSENIEKIAIPVSDGLVFVKVTEISHIEADGSYSNLYLQNGTKMLVSKKLKFFEDMLEGRTNFYRVHRSIIVNVETIKKYNRNDSLIVLENGTKLKVARDNKALFEDHLKSIAG